MKIKLKHELVENIILNYVRATAMPKDRFSYNR